MTFDEDLSFGQWAENQWIDLVRMAYPEYKNIKKLDGRKADFKLTSPFGTFTIELKSDRRNMNSTPNFFIERWSNFTKKTAGGPWQAKENGVDIIIYWYPINKKMFCFSVNQLVAFLEGELHVDNKPYVNVVNKFYDTKGYLILRADLADIATITQL